MATNNDNGAWVFISHSLKDWDKVRKIRNQLEEKGHKPLLFFLKCLHDDSEVDDLIKREIEARNWFLLCDSKNAKESKWVQTEVDFIKSLPDKVFEIVDLEKDDENKLDSINRLSKRITVFLSYSRSDDSIAKNISAALTANEYRVFDEMSMNAGQSFLNQIKIAIDGASKEGFIIILVSQNTITSKYCLHEIEYAIQKSTGRAGNIIIIFLTDPPQTISQMPTALQFLISGYQYMDFSKGSFSDNVIKLVKHMKTVGMV